jgi:dephospho-CoA kinase
VNLGDFSRVVPMSKVIVITGMPGSGKTEALTVAEELGIHVFRMGQCVVDEVKARGLKDDSEHVPKIAHEMRQTHGPRIWAERTVEKVRAAKPGKTIIIDGSRSGEEIETFREEWGNDLVIVAIHTSPGLRYERLMKRGRKDDPAALEKIKERDARELGWGLGEVISLADTVIINDGTLDELHRNIREILEDFI